LVEHQGYVGLGAAEGRQTQQQDILQKNPGTKPTYAAHQPLNLKPNFPQAFIQVFASGDGWVCPGMCFVDAFRQTVEGHRRTWMEEKRNRIP
jgi:hypothetical protein